jgi:predicted acetyltransferase
MFKLVSRSETYLRGYKDYCQEFFDKKIETFIPMNPEKVSVKWFRETLDWYKKRELGLIDGQSQSIKLWAIDDNKFIGEFQLRTELTEKIMTTIGSIGYSVRVTEQGKGYGKHILEKGLDYARSLKLKRVILLIDESNATSIHLCESFNGEYFDTIMIKSENNSVSKMCRYWINL